MDMKLTRAKLHKFGEVPEYSKIFSVSYKSQAGNNASERVEADRKEDALKFMASQPWVKKVISAREV